MSSERNEPRLVVPRHYVRQTDYSLQPRCRWRVEAQGASIKAKAPQAPPTCLVTVAVVVLGVHNMRHAAVCPHVTVDLCHSVQKLPRRGHRHIDIHVPRRVAAERRARVPLLQFGGTDGFDQRGLQCVVKNLFIQSEDPRKPAGPHSASVVILREPPYFHHRRACMHEEAVDQVGPVHTEENVCLARRTHVGSKTFPRERVGRRLDGNTPHLQPI